MFAFTNAVQELAVWRKQATISVQEEFVGRTLPPGLEDSLPPTLQDMFDTVRAGVRRSAEMYINLCQLMERLCKRNEGMAADYMRFGLALQSLTEASKDTYSVDANDVPLLNEGLNSTAKHLQSSQSLLEDEARAWDEGVLEDLKRQRDCLVSMRDLFDRRDRLDRDNIPQLERRIKNNENKLQGISDRPEHLVKPGEKEKVEEAIVRVSTSLSLLPGTETDPRPCRISNLSSTSTPAACSSRSVSVMRSCTSSSRCITSANCTKIGARNA